MKLESVGLFACVLVVAIACREKSIDDGSDFGSGGGGSPDGTFEVIVEGRPPSGGVVSPCRYVFDISEIPAGATDVVVETCRLSFVLFEDIERAGSMELKAPDGTVEVLALPTPDDPNVRATDFEGSANVDGEWRLVFEERFDCGLIELVTLSLSGEYEDS